jgi:hypothetical protein
MEHCRRLVADGEHWHILSALNVMRAQKLPMPDWLYDAIVAWLVRTETREQRQFRERRQKHEARAALVQALKAEGVAAATRYAEAEAFAEGAFFGAKEDQMRKSTREIRNRDRRAGTPPIPVPRKKTTKKRK